MGESFFALSESDKTDAQNLVATQSGRPVHLLEKDVWVVWCLQTLYQSEFASHLVFKGGTSLSKAYGIINRFSEDIDVTYDIRQIIPERTNDGVLPPSRSQENTWTKIIKQRLPDWVEDNIAGLFANRLTTEGIEAKVTQESENLLFEYHPVETGSGYVAPVVRVEFGVRSTGEPASSIDIDCEASKFLKEDVEFPSTVARVMSAERTFWEKATACHVYTAANDFGGRRARHWYDLTCLHRHGLAAASVADRTLAQEVAAHKSIFFRSRDANGNWIDYWEAVDGGLSIVPAQANASALKEDFQKMIEDGLLFDEPPPTFEHVIEQCAEIEALANDPTG